MSDENYPTLNRLLGSKWLEYMIECERYRPSPKRISPYVGTLVDLETGLRVTEKKLKSDSKFQNLLNDLKSGMVDEKWESFEHAFAIVKEIEIIIEKFSKYRLGLFPPIGNANKEMDFRLQIRSQWIYFEVKASPMLSFEQEFLNTNLEEEISQKISGLNSNMFFVICFNDLKPNQIDANNFYNFLKSATNQIKDSKNQAFPVLLNYPSDDEQMVQVLIVDRMMPLFCNEFTSELVKESITYSHSKNHFFCHFAPQRYDLKKRLKNLMEHATNQMDRNNPNVLIIYTREVVLGSIDELYNNCVDLFRDHNYTIIDAVVMNVQDLDQNIRRRLFERQNSKLPFPINALLQPSTS